MYFVHVQRRASWRVRPPFISTLPLPVPSPAAPCLVARTFCVAVRPALGTVRAALRRVHALAKLSLPPQPPHGSEKDLTVATMAASDSNSSSTTTPAAAPAPPKTDRDVEAQSERPWKVSHLRLVLDQAGVDSRVLDYAYPGDGTEDSPYVVDFLPGDPRNPMLLPVWRKWTYTMVASISTMAVSFASSASPFSASPSSSWASLLARCCGRP
ncbi:hypothetical protein VTK73DRAFT_3805 [Phialemonium thermophilum]|uniref:Uncharacterized protein n=1 Tax=Phialemonium thermophilum TaxID=223376 RepID=A0ABR3VG38_9PEZI